MQQIVCSERVFSDKYAQYSNLIFKIAMLHTGNSSDAEDITQDAFIRLFHKAPVFKDFEHERRWLIRVTINLCKDKKKSAWSKRTVTLFEVESTPDSSPDDLWLIEQVMSLPDSYRLVVHLHYYEGYDVKEIADILRIGASAVKMRLKRGREMLKIRLEDGHVNERTI